MQPGGASQVQYFNWLAQMIQRALSHVPMAVGVAFGVVEIGPEVAQGNVIGVINAESPGVRRSPRGRADPGFLVRGGR